MLCPYCNQEMKTGYLKGERGYALMWTDDPFKMTDIAFGDDLRICKETDIDRPTACLCKACRKIIMNI